MDILQKVWFLSFLVKEKDVASLVIQLVIHVALDIVIGFVIGILLWIPIVGVIVGLVGSLLGLYFLVGIVLCILQFCGVLKKA